MQEKAPISICIIVKNEPLLEECINSIRDYVKEIVIVDTGSTDGTIEVAQRLADVFEIYTDCNNSETDLIEDFSKARQRSFDLATQPWVMWVDADDIIVGGENLLRLTEINNPNADATVFLFPYEYSYDETGKCTCIHYRERLVSNKNKFHWINPVHEVLVNNIDIQCSYIAEKSVIYKHRKQYSNKPPELGRNLRILKNHIKNTGDSDPRQLYYIGLEYYNNNLVDEAIENLIKYVETSGWDEERAMACLKLVEICQFTCKYNDGIKWAFKAIEIQETWGEGYFALAKMFYFLAIQGGPHEMRNFERCTYFARIGLNLPATKTLLFINPLDRDYDIHRYLNVALSKLGYVKEALEIVNKGLQCKPNDQTLLTNKKIYEDWLIKQKESQIKQEDQQCDKNMIIKQSPFSIATKTSNNDTWSIPEVWDFDSYPIQMSDNQLQSVVLMVWKQYMLHDEVLSAISFLENAPYNVRHSAVTLKALDVTKSCLDWMNDKNDFQKINAPANHEVEAGNPLPNQLFWQEVNRFDLIKNNLPSNTTLVDFGCMDGCFTNRYGMLGHKVVGLDVCESSINLARKKAIEFNTGAEYVCTYFHEAADKVPNKHFEYATSSDTYEHLKDPINEMFIPAKSMLKEDGKFLLVTPHGSWLRGEYVDFASPWSNKKEGKSWIQPFPRAHLVAPTVWAVSDQFKQAGYWVKNSYVSLCEPQKDVEGQGNVFVEAHLQSPTNYDKSLDIVFFIGQGVEEWTPKSVEKNGIGGSELMAIHMSKRLAALGHKVRVYSGCGKFGEGIYDGVEYRTSDKYQDLKCDVLIVSRRADYLGDQYNIKANLRLLWVHDTCAISATNELLLKADRILCLSEWHKQNLITTHNLHPDHIVLTHNAIDLLRFENVNAIKRDRFKCINSSSPDRSWPILLTVWPKIKEQVPEATLTLAYGFKNWEYVAQFDPLQKNLIQRLKNEIKLLEPLGVRFIDRVNQKELAEEFLSAGCWVYPTWFQETSCISAQEATAAGLRIITSNIAALQTTVADRGILLNGAWTSDEYQKQFIEHTVTALKHEDDSDREKLQQYAKDNFCLDKLAQEWNKMFFDLAKEKEINPLVPYRPTARYIK